ncbi:hypothetical protein PR003_g12503 [Phytophthora rubi]|uniref:Uncharacterized protein n=1 Tax=Phytophthora rubi TaxID=129364 RepID=A0A6A4FCB2_9STRA|nr:hypothetical protein PR003_g12503 [Phytophthora rubi]
MTSSNGDADRDVDDVPPHAPEQLPIIPPIEVGTLGSGGAGGVADTPSDQAGDVPQTDSTVPGEFHSRKNAPEQDDMRPNSEVVPGPPTTGVDLSTIDDPAATAAAFASVGQLLVTQQIISEATAKYIFQGELNLTQSNSAAANPTLPGEVPPSRFGVRQDLSSFVVGIPAKHADRLSERFMRDGYGGLETLTFVETLSDEDVRDLSEMTDSRWSGSKSVPDLYSPEADSRAAQHRSNGCQDGVVLLEKLTEISNMNTGFALLNQHWKEAFVTSKRQLDQEISDHARDFKHVAQIHEREEEALRTRLEIASQERDDVFAYTRVLKSS